jgi:hypothetical protein
VSSGMCSSTTFRRLIYILLRLGLNRISSWTGMILRIHVLGLVLLVASRDSRIGIIYSNESYHLPHMLLLRLIPFVEFVPQFLTI